MQRLDDIHVEYDLDAMLGYLRLKSGSKPAAEFAELLEQAKKIVNPKVLYTISFIEEKGEDSVRFDGVAFTSRVLRANLDQVERAFPYIATCGSELDGIGTEGDMLKQYWLDEIKAKALMAAVHHLYNHIDKSYRPGKLSTMNPGSSAADVWPIEQQEQLFSLFGDVESLIGVRLTQSYLMVPNKTISGILFPAEDGFESCQLCPREICKGRRAPYDPELAASLQKGND
jgi:hypothetical protein